MNRYLKSNKIKVRTYLLLSSESYLNNEEITLIKANNPMPQWLYKIAQKEFEMGYLHDLHSEYTK